MPSERCDAGSWQNALLALRRGFLAGQNPALQLRHRAAFLDPDHVADLGRVGLVMGVIVLGAAHRLLQKRMSEATLHLHHHRLVVLVGDDDSLKDAFGHPILLRPWPPRRRTSGAGTS